MEESYPSQLKIPRYQDLFSGKTSQRGNWVVANVETSVAWPNKVSEMLFRNWDIFFLPFTQDLERNSRTYPAVAVNLSPDDDGQVLLMHFLSSLSWVKRQGINVCAWTGGTLPYPKGGHVSMPIFADEIYYPYLPDPQDTKTRWALGFYREGLYLKHSGYQCLSFFKILNTLHGTGKKQIEWINKKIPHIIDHQAKKRIEQLQRSEVNLGKYLYKSNRCAVAHAGKDPTFDPENPEDLRRLSEDLPLVQALAEIALEVEFGVKSASTVYREHLYELEGLRYIFGNDRVNMIKSNQGLPEEQWPQISNLSIRLALHDPYDPLENMTVHVKEIVDGAAIVRCSSENDFIQISLKLNFSDPTFANRFDQLQLNPSFEDESFR